VSARFRDGTTGPAPTGSFPKCAGPCSNLERDFRRRRQGPRKRPEDDISEQRPEFGDYHARELAAKTAFLLASSQSRVSEDWVVGAPGIEPVTR
jgi:hypothetical protein